MEKYNEIKGNLITLALQGKFDVITHGCNCFCTMGAGIAPDMAREFGCDKFPLESNKYSGDFNKLGQIEGKLFSAIINGFEAKNYIVLNSYTQYSFGKQGNKPPVDYDALRLCMRKINKMYKGRHIGLPQIGAGLAGGDWNTIKSIIKEELIDCITTVVIFDFSPIIRNNIR